MRTLALFLLLTGLIAGEATTLSESDYVGIDSKAMLGVTMTPPSSATQTKNGIDAETGVEVTSVYGGTAAEKMGLQNGDVITSINGSAVASMTDLRNEVALAGVGGQVDLVVLRDGQPVVTNGSLGEWPTTIPYEPIDAAAERRFRDWQGRRLERSQQAVANLSMKLEGLERKANQPAPQRAPGSLSPAAAAVLPISEALPGLPAWKLTLRTACDTKPGPASTSTRAPIAWDARVLLGTPTPGIF